MYRSPMGIERGVNKQE